MKRIVSAVTIVALALATSVAPFQEAKAMGTVAKDNGDGTLTPCTCICGIVAGWVVCLCVCGKAE